MDKMSDKLLAIVLDAFYESNLSILIQISLTIAGLGNDLWPLLLTWFNFNPSMDK